MPNPTSPPSFGLIVLLRGCNVGGHRRLRPTRLAEQLKEYDVVNIGAAGTFVVRGRISPARLRAELKPRLPFGAEMMICEARELLRATSTVPFADESPRADIIQFVSLLDKRPTRRPRIPLDIPADGTWTVRVLSTRGRFLFGLHRRQMKAIGCLGALDDLFGARATTRSWTTIATILKALEAEN